MFSFQDLWSCVEKPRSLALLGMANFLMINIFNDSLVLSVGIRENP